MTPREKQKKLMQLAELYSFCGYDFSNMFGKPLSYFDFNLIEETINRLETEKNEINGIKNK